MGRSVQRSAVVIAEFPYSNLSQTDIRPTVVLADAGMGDWVLGQLTRNPFGDSSAIELTNDSLAEGFLRSVSYFRPAKLFTANESLVIERVARLKSEVFNRLLDATMNILDHNRMRQ